MERSEYRRKGGGWVGGWVVVGGAGVWRGINQRTKINQKGRGSESETRPFCFRLW